MITQYIRIPFANGGDKEGIPQEVQTSGSISWPQGWGPDYELDIETEPSAKPIDRLDMNQLFYVITTALKYLQENFAPEWITASANGGVAMKYQTGQTVTYVDSSGNRSIWVSQADNNTATPGSDSAMWAPYLYRTASSSEIGQESSLYPVTPQQVLDLIQNNRQTINDATTSQKGVVQLSDQLYSTSSVLAATEKAVGEKYNQFSNSLGSKNLNDLKTSADRGVWTQTSDANCTTANGYPPGVAAGLLFVGGSVYSWPIHIYFSPLTGAVWSRRRAGSNNDWGDWNRASPEVNQATTAQAGVVRLSDSLNGTSSSLAATEKAVGQKVTFQGNLGEGVNLNTIVNESQRGVYCQQANANATLALNYPEAAAGTLYALGTIQSGLFQQYVTITGNFWTRLYNGNGTWNGWRRVNASVPPGVITFVAVAANAAPPDGYLVCNGAAVSRATYPALFSRIGTRYGAGNGTTTFNLPNIPAGWAAISNNGDNGLPISTAGQNLSHSHSGTAASAGSHAHSYSGNTSAAGAHSHTMKIYRGNGANIIANYAGTASDTDRSWTATTNEAGQHTHSYSGNTNANGAHTHNLTISNSGGSFNGAAGYYSLCCISF